MGLPFQQRNDAASDFLQRAAHKRALRCHSSLSSLCAHRCLRLFTLLSRVKQSKKNRSVQLHSKRCTTLGHNYTETLLTYLDILLCT
jgi:hypothetical protein